MNSRCFSYYFFTVGSRVVEVVGGVEYGKTRRKHEARSSYRTEKAVGNQVAVPRALGNARCDVETRSISHGVHITCEDPKCFSAVIPHDR